MRKKIGEALVYQGVITEKDLQMARFEQKRVGGRLGSVLVRLNMATEVQIAKALAKQFGIPYIDFVEEPPDPRTMMLIPKYFALKHKCVACRLTPKVLVVAMSDPLSLTVVHDLEFATGHRIEQRLAVSTQIVEAIEKGYSETALMLSSGVKQRNALESLNSQAQLSVSRADSHNRKSSEQSYFETPSEPKVEVPDAAGPIAHLVDGILEEALAANASDVHIEATETGVTVRHRLDGLLREVAELPKWAHEGLITRLKVLASLDIAERRLPQDGRLRIRSKDGRQVDFRLSSLKTLHGEKIVLRILDHSKGIPPLESLGFSASDLQRVQHFLKHQHGMILAVGPTGSGKSTTLASSLTSIKSVTTNIVTIEDPIEYEIPGINQTQIHDKIKLTFASSLRSILRQDPDVILVGEIRDHDTAKIAMQAAQTGHLVLSTLHTDDAPSVVTRLSDMGIEPYIIGSALLGVIGQRLVRRLCTNCRAHYSPSAEVLRALNLPIDQDSSWQLFRAVGCPECRQTGYRGRTAIYEVMQVTNRISRMISQKADENVIRDAALESGMTTLGEDGLAKVKAGVTSPDELLRVVTEVRNLCTFCPDCGCAVGVDFVACPECGRRLGGGCPKCNRLLRPTWQFCPYCASRTSRLASGPAQQVLPKKIDEFREASVR